MSPLLKFLLINSIRLITREKDNFSTRSNLNIKDILFHLNEFLTQINKTLIEN